MSQKNLTMSQCLKEHKEETYVYRDILMRNSSSEIEFQRYLRPPSLSAGLAFSLDFVMYLPHIFVGNEHF